MVTFKTKKKDLIKIFKHLCPQKRKKYSKYKTDDCEITVTAAKVAFASRGGIFSLDCITIGTVKVVVPVYYLFDIIDVDPSENIEFSITEGSMKINNVTINVNTCFLKDDKILRTIKLPINYNSADVIKLLNDHTEEELLFNRVYGKIIKELSRLENNIIAAYVILKEYGVTHKEIEKLVVPKLLKDGKIPKEY